MIPFNEMLDRMIAENGSDLFLTAKTYPYMKVGGKFVKLSEDLLEYVDTEKIAVELMDEKQRAEFYRTNEMNLAFTLADKGRFRTNIFMQRGAISIVIRLVKFDIPDFNTLGLPKALADLIMEDRGLILVTGATGSGKSTTLASMINYRNENRAGHIITLEDPIEFIHFPKKSIINQREVGLDTDSYSIGLKNVLRQAPDVILIGEIRDLETMESAMSYAETGHLVLSTLHSTNAKQTLERIVQFYPDGTEKTVLQQLSNILIGIISQRLIPKKDGTGRVAAVEVMKSSARIRELIYKGELGEITPTIEISELDGMRSFDQALLKYYHTGVIDLALAKQYSDNPSDLALKAAGVTTGSVKIE